MGSGCHPPYCCTSWDAMLFFCLFGSSAELTINLWKVNFLFCSSVEWSPSRSLLGIRDNWIWLFCLRSQPPSMVTWGGRGRKNPVPLCGHYVCYHVACQDHYLHLLCMESFQLHVMFPIFTPILLVQCSWYLCTLPHHGLVTTEMSLFLMGEGLIRRALGMLCSPCITNLGSIWWTLIPLVSSFILSTVWPSYLIVTLSSKTISLLLMGNGFICPAPPVLAQWDKC